MKTCSYHSVVRWDMKTCSAKKIVSPEGDTIFLVELNFINYPLGGKLFIIRLYSDGANVHRS